MTESPIIRQAQLQDLATLVRFNQALVEEARGKKLEPQTLTKGVKAVLNDPNRGFYTVVQIAGIVAAAALVTFEWSDFRNAWFWWLQDVYVEPSYRQQGIFRLLYQHLKTQAQMKEVCGLRLYVYKGNTKAQEVYSRLGMVESDSLMFEEFF